MERGWGDPEAKIWAKAWKLDCLGCSWGERELPKNRLRQRVYLMVEVGERNRTGTGNEGGA